MQSGRLTARREAVSEMQGGRMKLLIRHDRSWEFHWHASLGWRGEDFPEGWYHLTKDNLYRAFIDGGRYGDVWIGRLYNNGAGAFWGTVEAELRATNLRFGRGIYRFRRGEG